MEAVFLAKEIIIFDKGVNKEALGPQCLRCGNEGYITFKEIGENWFLIEFQKVVEKEKIMLGRTWSFDKSLVQDFEANIAPSEFSFSQEHFWLQFHNLPLASMSKEVGVQFGSAIS